MDSISGQLPNLASEFVLAPSGDHVLLRELAHRVNNEFTSVINTMSRVAARSANPAVKAALSEATEMLHSYVDVHRALKLPSPDTPVDAAEYLHRLCTVMHRATLERMGIGLVFDSAALTLGPERSWYLGLIVHELVANAARHAFAGRGGEIRVELRCTGDVVQCRIRDNGSGSSDFQRGEGLTIVAQLANELGGTMQHRFGPNGSTSILAFPLSARNTQTSAAGSERAQLDSPVTGMSSGSEPARARTGKVSLLPDIHDRGGWLRWSVEAHRSAKARE
jgi:two-component sensor histidine kinase